MENLSIDELNAHYELVKDVIKEEHKHEQQRDKSWGRFFSNLVHSVVKSFK